MPKMIKLTLVDHSREFENRTAVYINTRHVGSVEEVQGLNGEFDTRLVTRAADSFIVKETPEQILQLIKEAE